MTGHPLTCERCGDALEGSYRTQTYSATHQLQQIAPDGGSTTIIAGAFVACSWNCLAVLAALKAGSQGDAAVRIVAERERQQTQEGFSPERDAGMPEGDFARAAICYAGQHAPLDDAFVETDQDIGTAWRGSSLSDEPALWPWGHEWWKPKNHDRDLVRAGALIAAELDRDPAKRGPVSGEPF